MKNVLEVGAVFNNGGKEFEVLAIRGDIAVVKRLNFDFLGSTEYIVANGLMTKEDGSYIWCWGHYFYDYRKALCKGGFIDYIGESNIKLEEYPDDTWYVIDTQVLYGEKYYLLENEEWGDEVPCVITDMYGIVVVDDVYNGFDDLLVELGVL